MLVSQVKTPKDMVKVVDADWGASDRPVLATVDGCIRVMDMGMRTSNSPLHTYSTKGEREREREREGERVCVCVCVKDLYREREIV